MDFSTKVFIIGPDFKDLSPSMAKRNIYAEVVLIDRLHPDSQPALYQLNNGSAEEDLKAIKQGIISLQSDAFVMVGEVVSINKKSKTIILSNENTVTYKYLIIANAGRHQHVHGGEEFNSSLNTLFYALLMSKKIPNSFSTTENKKELDSARLSQVGPQEAQAAIEKIVNSNLSKDNTSHGAPIGGPQKICEIQM